MPNTLRGAARRRLVERLKEQYARARPAFEARRRFVKAQREMLDSINAVSVLPYLTDQQRDYLVELFTKLCGAGMVIAGSWPLRDDTSALVTSMWSAAISTGKDGSWTWSDADEAWDHLPEFGRHFVDQDWRPVTRGPLGMRPDSTFGQISAPLPDDVIGEARGAKEGPRKRRLRVAAALKKQSSRQRRKKT